MTKTIHGKVRGRTIELDEDLGVAEGQEVEVQVKLVQRGQKWGEGILRSAGVAAEIPEFDQVFEQVQREREASSSRELED